MPTELGPMIGIAFNAVRQCHQDLGRLLSDLDGMMTGTAMKRVWDENAVTRGVSLAAGSPYWMARKIYRLYYDPMGAPNVVEGINIRFFSKDGSLNEPRLVAGRTIYDVPPAKNIQKVAKTWDLDKGYHEWCNAPPEDLGKPLLYNHTENGPDQGRVVRMGVIARDLYSITAIVDIRTMLEDVRKSMDTITR